jgi:hypothetical protein
MLPSVHQLNDSPVNPLKSRGIFNEKNQRIY